MTLEQTNFEIMATKTINGIEYIVYEAGMLLNDITKSYYFENDLDYDGEIKCLHFYAVKSVTSRNQDVGGKINLDPTDRNYKKIASAFLVARQMKAHLALMNKKD